MNAHNMVKDYTHNSSQNKKTNLQNLYQLKETLIEDEVQNNQNYDDIVNEISQSINEIEEERTRESMFRSRSQYSRLGEKSTAYFYALEKRNYKNKMISAMYVKGTLTKNQKVILEEQQKFDENLYASDPSIEFTMQNNTAARLTPTIDNNR